MYFKVVPTFVVVSMENNHNPLRYFVNLPSNLLVFEIVDMSFKYMYRTRYYVPMSPQQFLDWLVDIFGEQLTLPIINDVYNRLVAHFGVPLQIKSLS